MYNITHSALKRQVDVITKQVVGAYLRMHFWLICVTKRFIELLKQHLLLNALKVHLVKSDADTMIVSVALNCSEHGNTAVAILAEDTDILALLCHHRKPSLNEVFFVSPSRKGKDGKRVEGKSVNIGVIQKEMGHEACERILVVHATGSCDTTSVIFDLGKGSVYNKFASDSCTQSLFHFAIS